MSEKKQTPALVKVEFIVFGVILLIFLVWVSGRCSRTQQDLETAALRDSENLLADSLHALGQSATPATTARIDSAAVAASQPTTQKVTPLFVNIDGLNMRSGPGLRYELIDRFPLFTELTYLGEVTPTLDTIKLGAIVAVEPWVKVRSPKGREGWVYGAGVSYYRREIKVE